MEILAKLGVDWKLLLAQGVNFLLLLYILKRFAYRPVLKLLDERSRRIEKGLEDAAAAEAKLSASLEKEKEILAAAREEARETLTKATALAKERDAEMLATTKHKIDAMIAEADAQLAAKQQKLLLEAKAELAEVVLASLDKILPSKANRETDAALVAQALREIK